MIPSIFRKCCINFVVFVLNLLTTLAHFRSNNVQCCKSNTKVPNLHRELNCYVTYTASNAVTSACGDPCANRTTKQRYVMPPPHRTLAKPKSGFFKLSVRTIDIIQCRAQLAKDVACLKSGGSKLNYRPYHRYLDMRQECRTFKSVASRSCDCLFLVLAIGVRGAPLTKPIISIKTFGDGTKTIQHSFVGRYNNDHV